MKTKLQTIDGTDLYIDLADVSMLEMHGQRESKAGWVKIKLTLRSGQVVETKLTPEEYDIIKSKWLAGPAA